MYHHIPLKPYPNGWYVIVTSRGLKSGDIITRKFCGMDVVIFRTVSGKVCVSDAFCPHMGAHFAYGGKIEGETIQCPFHHFCFDTQGNCTATGYGTKPSPRMKLRIWNVREKNGFILCWFDEKGNEPTWEVPDIADDGFSEILTTDWKLQSHPQETTENSVDLGHFGIVHGYKDVYELSEFKTDEHYLNTHYTIARKADFIGSSKLLRMELNVRVWGLGYSFVEVDIPEYGMQTRQYVFPSPMDERHINLKVGMSVKLNNPSKISPLLALAPKEWLTRLILPQAFKGYCTDVQQDFKVWENKIYIDPPALAKGDGPVAQYRLWCRQFYYPENTQHNHVSVPALTAA